MGPTALLGYCTDHNVIRSSICFFENFGRVRVASMPMPVRATISALPLALGLFIVISSELHFHRQH